MICPNCGKDIDEGNNFCPLCGNSFDENMINDSFNKYKQDEIIKQNTPVEDSIRKHFNWGAFGFTFIWGLCNNSYITLIFIPLIFVPRIIGIICCIAAQIWFGINGNTWAWKNKHWVSESEFHATQKKWAIAYAIILVVLIAIIPLVAFLIPEILYNAATTK